jgi:hypothetical protein
MSPTDITDLNDKGLFTMDPFLGEGIKKLLWEKRRRTKKNFQGGLVFYFNFLGLLNVN